MSKKIDNPNIINLTLLSRFKEKIDALLEKKVNRTDIATTEQLGLIKPDGNTILVNEDGVLSSVATSNVKEKELLLSEYQALSKEEKNNDTNYYITDADNISDVNSVGTAGSLKPWLYDSDEEVVIGVYDGKPLYRRILTNTIETNLTTNAWIPIPFIDVPSDIDYCNCANINNIKDNFIISDNRIRFIYSNGTISGATTQTTGQVIPAGFLLTIEYTKTTDEENSGVNLMPYTYVQNASNNYSTDEQIIGRWIDGRPLYQKTITDYDILNTANGTVLIAENLEFLVAQPEGVAEGLSVYGSLNHEVLPKLSTDNTYILAIREQDGYIYIEKGSSFSNGTYTYFKASITFRYTKTTD